VKRQNPYWVQGRAAQRVRKGAQRGVPHEPASNQGPRGMTVLQHHFASQSGAGRQNPAYGLPAKTPQKWGVLIMGSIAIRAR